MKILAFTDIHGSLSVLEHLKKQASKVDFFICTGDYTVFENHIEFMMQKMDELGKPVLLVHGNHEDEDSVRILCKNHKSIEFMHEKAKKIGNYLFLGFGGGGFSYVSPEFVDSTRKLLKGVKNEKIVLLTHQPVHNTAVDIVPGYGHVGNKDFRKFVDSHNVALSISGHIHETFGKKQKIGRTIFLNPGPKGTLIELK
jgi:Icc-related predicted phosphoesterase